MSASIIWFVDNVLIRFLCSKREKPLRHLHNYVCFPAKKNQSDVFRSLKVNSTTLFTSEEIQWYRLHFKANARKRFVVESSTSQWFSIPPYSMLNQYRCWKISENQCLYHARYVTQCSKSRKRKVIFTSLKVLQNYCHHYCLNLPKIITTPTVKVTIIAKKHLVPSMTTEWL